MDDQQGKVAEYALLGVLALFWGSSYLFTKIAVTEITPITLIALRVSGAALFLFVVLVVRGRRLPRSGRVWAMLGVQSLLNSTVAWTILAWGQQYVDAGLASVLNSTSPIFVFLFTALITRHEVLGGRKLAGAILGLGGVIMIVGIDSLAGLGQQVAGQLACLAGAMLYGAAAIWGRRFSEVGALETSLGTMLLASLVLVPLAFVVEDPLALHVSFKAMGAVAVLAIVCTGVALLIYFRLVHTLGSLGVASQAYLRAGIGVVLGALILGEAPAWPTLIGLVAAITGVALINSPRRVRT